MSKYYEPDELFEQMPRLAPTFAQNRYKAQFPYTPRIDKDALNLERNAAALELYNKDDLSKNPIIQRMYSKPIYGSKPLDKNYGHSEPRLMQYALDKLIGENNAIHEIPLPSALSPARTVQDREYDNLRKLVENPYPYKAFMDRQRQGLNMISELPFCSSTDPNCSEFMSRISPEESKFGHTVYGWWNDYKDGIKDAARRLGPAYQAYMNNNINNLRSIQQENPFSPQVVQNYQSPSNSSSYFSQSLQSPALKKYESPDRRLSLTPIKLTQNTPMGSHESSISPFKTPRLTSTMQSPIRPLPSLGRLSFDSPVQLYSPYNSSMSMTRSPTDPNVESFDSPGGPHVVSPYRNQIPLINFLNNDNN